MLQSKVVVLYPADLFSPTSVDVDFIVESQAVAQAGFRIQTVDGNATVYGDSDVSDFFLYRGWMLDDLQYDKLSKATGGRLLVSPLQYTYNHYMPNWYRDFKGLTPATQFVYSEDFDNVLKAYSQSTQKKFFIKDFVKSIKLNGPAIIETANQLQECLKNMVKYRGRIEGGISFRQVMDLVPSSEFRVFFVNDKTFGKIPPYAASFVQQCTQAYPHKKGFISMDFAKTIEGTPVLIEIGDGQVSDYNADNSTQGVELTEFISAIQYYISQTN